MQGEIVTINSRKYDLSIRRSWECRLLEQTGSLLVFAGIFDDDLSHPELGLIRRGTISYEYYWLDRWYNIFRFHEPSGSLRNYYCNINLPPSYKKGVLDYVDLDIDVVVWDDFTYKVLDMDEYEVNAAAFVYPEYVTSKVKKAVTEIAVLIETREFPFGSETARNIFQENS